VTFQVCLYFCSSPLLFKIPIVNVEKEERREFFLSRQQQRCKIKWYTSLTSNTKPFQRGLFFHSKKKVVLFIFHDRHHSGYDNDDEDGDSDGTRIPYHPTHQASLKRIPIPPQTFIFGV
jgi:hypothetical protein